MRRIGQLVDRQIGVAAMLARRLVIDVPAWLVVTIAGRAIVQEIAIAVAIDRHLVRQFAVAILVDHRNGGEPRAAVGRIIMV